MIRTALSGALFAALLTPAPAAADDLRERIAADLRGLMATYRDFHTNPELLFAEVRPAKIMAYAACKAGFAVTEQVGKTGVVAVLRNRPPEAKR